MEPDATTGTDKADNDTRDDIVDAVQMFLGTKMRTSIKRGG